MSPAQNFPEHLPKSNPECVICKTFVNLEQSKADEYGQAVHEDCYVSRLTEKKPPFLSLC